MITKVRCPKCDIGKLVEQIDQYTNIETGKIFCDNCLTFIPSRKYNELVDYRQRLDKVLSRLNKGDGYYDKRCGLLSLWIYYDDDCGLLLRTVDDTISTYEEVSLDMAEHLIKDYGGEGNE